MNRCQNCDWRGPDEDLGRQLEDIPHLLERVSPGEPMPSGECPLCGALCQPIVMTRDEAAGVAIEALTYALENDHQYLNADTVAEWQTALDVLSQPKEVAQ